MSDRNRSTPLRNRSLPEQSARRSPVEADSEETNRPESQTSPSGGGYSERLAIAVRSSRKDAIGRGVSTMPNPAVKK